MGRNKRRALLTTGAVVLFAAGALHAQPIVYVDADAPPAGNGASWATAFRHPQDALQLARSAPGSVIEIRVATGTYMPDGGRISSLGFTPGSGSASTSFELVEGVKLRGGYAGLGAPNADARNLRLHTTRLSGDLLSNDAPNFVNRNDNSFHVVFTQGHTAATLFDGFVVSGGFARTGTPRLVRKGGGLLALTGAPGVLNCVFVDNEAQDEGGGAASANFVTGNQSVFANCLFRGNRADRGGGFAAAGDPGNAGEPAPTLVNSVCFGNTAPNGGSGVWVRRADLFARNNVVYGNSGSDQVEIGLNGDTDFAFSIVGGGFSAGTAIMDADPLFVDPDGPDNIPGNTDDNFRLSPGSPAIDSGSNDGVPSDVYDLDGDGDTSESLSLDLDLKSRRADAGDPDPFGNIVVDMGAYESPACQLCLGERLWQQPAGGSFETPAHWNPGVPGVSNTAVFDLVQAYTVHLNADADNFALRIRAGAVTLDLGDNSYNLSSGVETGVLVGESVGDSASLTIRNGALLCEHAEIGRFAGSVGAVTLDAPGTLWFLQEDLVVGLAGAGSLDITNGAAADTLQTTIGAQPTSSGAVSVSGAGSRLDSVFLISVENGSLEVSNGATVAAGLSILGGILLFDDGSLSGDGTIEANVFNFGEVFGPRDPPAARGAPQSPLSGLTVAFNYQQIGQLAGRGETSGTLGLLVDTASPVPSSTAMTVHGNAMLAGGLVVEFTDATPANVLALSGVPVLSVGGTLTDRFDVALLPGLPPAPGGTGRFLRVQYPAAPVTNGAADRGLVSVTLVVDSLGEVIVVDPEQNFSVTGSPVAAAAADFGDGSGGPPDGLIDLAVAVPSDASPGDVVILFNAGTDVGGDWLGFTAGTAQFPVGVDPSAVAAGDVNNDGAADLVVTNRGDNSLTILRNNGLGDLSASSTQAVGIAPSGVVVGELDNTSGVDVAVANEGSNSVSILLNQGGSGAGWAGLALAANAPVGGAPTSIIRINADDDKWDDLVVPKKEKNNISLLANTGLAVFAQEIVIPVGDGPNQAVAADLDLDGRVDLAVANEFDGTVSIIKNTSSGPGSYTFAPSVELPVALSVVSLAAVDLDSDGDPDLAAVADAGAGANAVKVLRNDLTAGDLIFAPDSDLPTGPDPRFVLAADIDNQNGSDVLTINAGTTLFVRGARGIVPQTIDAVTAITQAAPAPPECPGDANADHLVDFNDLVEALGHWLADYAPGTGPGDANGDGSVNFDDIVTVLGNWLVPCP